MAAASSATRNSAPGLVTRRACTCPVRRPSRTTRFAEHAGLGLAVPRGEPLLAAPCLDGLAHLVDPLGGEDVAAHVVDQVEAAGAVEAEHELAALVLAERVLELVAVAEAAPPPARSARPAAPRSRRCARARREPAPPSPRAGARTGAPARARPGAGASGSIRSGLGSSSSTESASAQERFDFADPRADAVARHGAAHEHDVARVRARDTGAAVGEPVDGQLELVPAARAGPGCLLLAGRQPSLDVSRASTRSSCSTVLRFALRRS